jgi:hypothetical protein
LSILSSLAAQSQIPTSGGGGGGFPYHIQGVDSNDTLFSGEVDYLTELNGFIDQMLGDVLEIMAQLKEDHDVSAQKNQGMWKKRT